MVGPVSKSQSHHLHSSNVFCILRFFKHNFTCWFITTLITISKHFYTHTSLSSNNPLPNLPHNSIFSPPDNINNDKYNCRVSLPNPITNSKTQIVFKLHKTKPHTQTPFLTTIWRQFSILSCFSNFKLLQFLNIFLFLIQTHHSSYLVIPPNPQNPPQHPPHYTPNPPSHGTTPPTTPQLTTPK